MEGGERRQHRRGNRGGRHRQRRQLHPSRYADAPGRQAEIHQGRHGGEDRRPGLRQVLHR